MFETASCTNAIKIKAFNCGFVPFVTIVKSCTVETHLFFKSIEGYNFIGNSINGKACLAFYTGFLNYIFPVTHHGVNADIKLVGNFLIG